MGEAYEGLLQHTWTLWTVSPLYRPSTAPLSVDDLRHSLFAFAERDDAGDESSGFAGVVAERLEVDSAYKFPAPLLFDLKDGDKDVFSAILIPKGRSPQGGPFLDVVCLLTRGNTKAVTTLREWLHFHFDCHTLPLAPAPFQLTALVGVWVSHAAAAHKGLELRYALPPHLDSVAIRIPAHDVTRMLDAIHAVGSEVGTAHVGKALLASVHHNFKQATSIDLSHATLCSVATGDVVVNTRGRLRCLTPYNVNLVVESLVYLVKNSLS